MSEKKYVIDNAKLMAEWNWEKNNDFGFDPKTLTLGSEKKTWWKCSKSHEWEAMIANRNKGNGCPYCAGRKVLKGYNDLQTVTPTLAKEWNYKKNSNLKPEFFTANSGQKVWWICNNGHEWQATIDNRNKGNGCPYCSGRKVLKGYNDLQTVNPIVAKEWNYEKNNELTPVDVTLNSNKKVWWKCSNGHEWQAKICHRSNGSGCPVCNSERNTSFPEYAIAYYLKKYSLDVIHSYREKGYELDIYIPSKKTAIEYDGYFWHKNKAKKDINKNLNCQEDGIKLYRIREDLPPLNDTSIDYVIQRDQKDFPQMLEVILSNIIGTNVDVDIERDAIAIENLREHLEKENSILHSNPEIAKEWNYEKNVNLKPEHFAANSNKKVWWKCSKGHEWQAVIASRNSGGHGCPYCLGLYAVKGENDLQTVNPGLAKEWNWEMNGTLTPEHFTANSGKKVWWKCSKGHAWQAKIYHRNNGSGCPYCSGRFAVNGENDLQTVNPALAKEWNYARNNRLTPMDVTSNSHKKVWWKCSQGHEWQSKISHRNNGIGCPYCSNQKVLKGYNDLQTFNPTLANEWDYDKNGEITPAMVTLGSTRKVWWKCSEGHEWQAVINNRSKGRGCPYCSGRYAIKGRNDLQTVNPILSNEWNYEKNNGLTPAEVLPNSGKNVWWKCSEGHEWQARIADRNKGRGCPICRKTKNKEV